MLRNRELSTKQRLYKYIRVEFRNIFGFFAQADKFYRYIELVLDGDNDSAPRGAVEFRREYACNADGNGVTDAFVEYAMPLTGGLPKTEHLNHPKI